MFTPVGWVSEQVVYSMAVRGGAAGAARAAPLFVAKFVTARVHSPLSGAMSH